MKYSRREFLKVSGTTIACTCLSGLLTNNCSHLPTAPEIADHTYIIDGDMLIVFLNRVPELSLVGGAVTIDDHDLPNSLIIARADENEYVVASNRCTHRGKPLNYDHEALLFRCAGGKSEFALDGTVLKNPAEISLRIYPSLLEGDRLIIDLSN
ncbi:MAG: Rieske 2Fe-2S domain-containing protein [Candidatus Aminicenantes bacterium]|nr:Rieske 2Fe-2S domain-containing protein [Candidatus Aminicenantes bacterium]